MRYVDGFVLPVPKKNLPAYRRMAQKAGKIWREHGALEFRECVGDDLDVKMGGIVPAHDQAQARRDSRVLMDHVQIARTSRSRQRKSHERPAPDRIDGFQVHAIRRQAHGLWWLHGIGRCLGPRSP